MAIRVAIPINNFSSGELSPLLLARTDLAKYSNGCERLLNWLPLPYGGVRRRPGTRYVAEVKTSSKATRLVPFEFSTIQAYMLEFGNLYIRFLKDGGQIVSGGSPVEVVSPYLEADLFQLKFAQSADTLYIVHPDYAPRKLTRSSHTAWTLSVINFLDGPFRDENADPDWVISAAPGEVIVNGTFTTDITGWTDVSVGGGSIAWNAGGFMDLVNVAGDKGAARQSVTTLAGVVFSVTFTVGVGNLSLRIGSTAGGVDIQADTPYAPGTYTVPFTAVTATTFFEFSNVTNGTTHTLDTVTMPNYVLAGAMVSLTATKPTWQAGHVGALWRLSEAQGSSTAKAWAAGVAKVVGEGVVSEGRTYQATTAGTTGTVPPVHLRGTVSDGGVNWAYLHDGQSYVKLTAVTDSTHATGTVQVNILPASVVPAYGGTGTTYWQEGAWSDVLGYPGAISFNQQRLVFGGTPTFPSHTFWSESGVFEGFREGVDDDQAMQWQIASNQVNAILWLMKGKHFFAGTNGAVHALKATSEQAITPTAPPDVDELTSYGSANIQPVKAGTNLIYIQRNLKKFRELAFDVQQDSYVPRDITVLSEHITGTGVVEATYQQSDQIVWAVRSDGVLIALTYLPEQDVIGWSRHTTDGFFESVATIPSGTEDQVWAVVKRTINGATKRYIEYLDADLNTDCALTYSGVPADVISGLSHLEAKSVKVIGNGAVLTDETISGGSITLEREVEEAEIGLNYDSDGLTVRPEVKAQDGTVQGVAQRITEVFVRVKDTAALTVDGDALIFHEPEDDLSQPPQELTGDKDCTLVGYQQHAQISFQQTVPMRATILGFFGVVDAGDI